MSEHHAQVVNSGYLAHALIAPSAQGIVYAVFQRTFYIKTSYIKASGVPLHLGVHSEEDKGTPPLESADTYSDIKHTLCCVGPSTLVHGPLNIATSLTDVTTVSIGSKWYRDSSTLIIGAIRLDLSLVDVWQPTHHQNTSKPTDRAVEKLYQFVENHAIVKTVSSSPEQRIDRLIERQLSNASDQLAQWLERVASERIGYYNEQANVCFPETLLGCGMGLTPAGDDILVGALLALRKWRKPQLAELISKVIKHLELTSDISAAHLLAACEGSGIEPLHQLLAAMSDDRPDCNGQLMHAAKQLQSYGHSSGYYAMQGVLIAARC